MAIKASKVAGWVFFAVVGAATVGALLATFGIVDKSDCTRTSEASNGVTGTSITAEQLQGMALQVRSNDAALGKQLRERLVGQLAGRGVTDTVDNPVAKKVLTLTLTEMNGRWTPFHATVDMKVQAQLDLDTKRRGPRAADISVQLTGVCNGLVKKDGWLDAAVVDVVDRVVDQLLPR